MSKQLSVEQTPVITGLGVVSPIGQGTAAFGEALMAGASRFGMLQREGRGQERFIGAELTDFSPPLRLQSLRLRQVGLPAQVAVSALEQAWQQAQLDTAGAAEVGLLVGGSNLNQRQQYLHNHRYSEKVAFVRPTYASGFMDTDLVAVLTQAFAITAPSYTLGGASSSGQLALIQAARTVHCGDMPICIALGALQDISELELQAFISLGAMVDSNEPQFASQACRPFDADHGGFVYGENCAALVVESLASAQARGVQPLARIAGSAVVMDAQRGVHPSLQGEVQAMTLALAEAGWSPGQVDLVSPHGTGSQVGDEIELQALQQVGLSHAWINTPKSITGHGLSAAGAVELVASVLQLQQQTLHPCRNLSNPIAEMNWVNHTHQACVNRTLNLSLGFGGINTAVCLETLL